MRKMYSSDLREIVLKKLKTGITKVKLEKEFEISSRTIWQWEKIQKIENRTSPIPYKMRNQRTKTNMSKIKDLKEFKNFIDSNHGVPSRALAILWTEKTKISVTQSAILRALKKIDYTFKKKLHFIKKDAQQKENSMEMLLIS